MPGRYKFGPREVRGDQDASARLREAHHRIKNHLQLVASGLSLEARRCSDPNAARVLLQACGRVIAIGRVHAKLMELEDGSDVMMAPFIQELCDDLGECFHKAGAQELHLSTKVRADSMPAKCALAVGGIVSELVTNAVKHYDAGKTCEISVLFEQQHSKGRLTVADQGPGMDSDEMLHHGGLGSALVRNFAAQLGGSLQLDPVDRGSSVSVVFG